mmetsp:Transcript_16046/g.43630  ORF Transcript_16046/g.43630 Transcript_16046/m.43630 type:complete len:115 (-) Transcript_16046:40-384(-)|eukprot:CAMPEP_0194479006 /NCGR_PEP_ID=MMETSP0253-20130528/2269_1 /TAXON_ID=2966 /ORGANISM="Noctiluca scintillans" /LENGTH=114 /DNA_ID=CAMNT_0039318175 /DNA_START=45 /DNA_END=389 /DNA_ORIENTATION=-
MVLTSLGRTVARRGVLGRLVAANVQPQAVRLGVSSPMSCSAVRSFAGYDYNMGIPGSRMKNPDYEGYNDVYPSQGLGWWALISVSTACWFWGNWYDTSRGVIISIGLFGPNSPL